MAKEFRTFEGQQDIMKDFFEGYKNIVPVDFKACLKVDYIANQGCHQFRISGQEGFVESSLKLKQRRHAAYSPS